MSKKEEPKAKDLNVKINKETVPILKLFQFASKTDLFLIIIATVTSIISGVILPISIIFFGDVLKKMAEAVANELDIMEHALPVVRLYVYLGVGVLVASYISNALWVLTGELQTKRIRQLYLHSILRQDMSWFDKAEEGSLSTRLASDIVLIQEGISEKFGQTILGISQFLAGCSVAFYKGWRLAIVMAGVAPLIVILGGLLGLLVTKYTVEAQNAYAEAGSICEQVFEGIRTVYSFSLQNRFADKYNKKLDKAMKAGVKRGIILGTGFGIFMFCLFSMYGFSFWYGSKSVHEHKMDGTTVLVVFLAMMMGEMCLLSVPTNLAAVSGASAAAFKIFQTIQRVPLIDSASHLGVKPSNVRGEIEFTKVKFSYPTRPDTVILKNLSLKIKPGMTVAFVGPSGSGKSTSVSLLQRFYDPLDGKITLDGINIKDYNVQCLRENIGVVSQEPVLFNTSIRENLTMGSPTGHVTLAEIVDACKKANCHSFIKQLPNGYDTLVGEHGGMLSGGQKQRIAIARAILKNPAILLLDEATSALDTQSERLVQKALDEASTNRTTIIIAHRLSTVRNADLIIVMENGDLVEKGTHKELSVKGGIYSELVKKQQIDITVNKSDDFVEKDDVINDEDLLQQEALELNRKSAVLTKFSEDSSVNDAIYSKEHIKKSESIIDGHEEKKKQEAKEKFEAKKMKAPVIRVFKEMRPQWGWIALGCIGSCFSGSAFPIYSLFFSKVVGVLIQNDDRDYGPMEGPNLYSFSFFMVGVCALFGFATQVVSFEIAGAKYTRELRSRLFKAYIKQEIGFFDQSENTVGSLTAKLAIDSRYVNEMVSKVWGEIVQIIVTATIGLSIAFSYSWKLTLIILCMAPLLIGSSAWNQQLQDNFQNNIKENGSETAEVANEAIKQIRTVSALNKQTYFEDKFYKANETIHKLSKRQAFISSIGFGFLQSSAMFANAVGFFAGAKLIIKNQIAFQDMIVTLMAVIFLSESIGRSSIFIATFTKAKISAITVFQVLDRVPSIDPDLEGIEPDRDDINGDIDFTGVGFRYPARPDVPIFQGEFNLRGKSGQTIALVGPSGCGKSTTIGMLQRWYDTLKGAVRLDNHNVKSFSVKNLRSHMALVGQEPVLFDFSIGDNIRFGVDDSETVTQQQVEEACKAANIHQFIKALPDGYDTRVGDKGSQLSGGQKQRIAIARALIRKPKILLLDEATSALDSESEKLVQEALDNILDQGGRTTITIAHRLSTITNSDLICVIKDGRVIEQGNHWELLRLNGVYTELVNQQSLNTT